MLKGLFVFSQITKLQSNESSITDYIWNVSTFHLF